MTKKEKTATSIIITIFAIWLIVAISGLVSSHFHKSNLSHQAGKYTIYKAQVVKTNTEQLSKTDIVIKGTSSAPDDAVIIVTTPKSKSKYLSQENVASDVNQFAKPAKVKNGKFTATINSISLFVESFGDGKVNAKSIPIRIAAISGLQNKHSILDIPKELSKGLDHNSFSKYQLSLPSETVDYYNSLNDKASKDDNDFPETRKYKIKYLVRGLNKNSVTTKVVYNKHKDRIDIIPNS